MMLERDEIPIGSEWRPKDPKQWAVRRVVTHQRNNPAMVSVCGLTPEGIPNKTRETFHYRYLQESYEPAGAGFAPPLPLSPAPALSPPPASGPPPKRPEYAIDALMASIADDWQAIDRFCRGEVTGEMVAKFYGLPVRRVVDAMRYMRNKRLLNWGWNRKGRLVYFALGERDPASLATALA